jgi:hypothetical protein
MTIISRQLSELEDARRQLQEQQQLRRQEDLELSAWIETRESWIREREEEFHSQLARLTQSERQFQSERDQWRGERIQIEQIIRDLVRQLESGTEANVSRPCTLTRPAPAA